MLVAFRADASTRLGSGHVVRCAALARALQGAGARSVFLCTDEDGHMLEWLAGQGWDAIALRSTRRGVDAPPWQIDAAEDAGHTLSALDGLGAKPDWLVADHYGIDAQWEAAVRPVVGRMLVIDDLANRHHLADTLVDPNLQPRGDRYRSLVSARCRMLLGPRFALLRPEFAEMAGSVHRDRPVPTRLLACMGGTDPLNALGTVLDAWVLLASPRPALDLVVGLASPNLPALRERCARLQGVTLHVQATNMAALMANATLLLGSAGSISWERCAVGLPAIMGATANNQRSNLELLARARTGISIGDWGRPTAERLAALIQRVLGRPRLMARMAARSRGLVDARGATRVGVHMTAASITLRPARPQDAEPAWRWRNAYSTRRYFHDLRPVELNAHLSWWATTLADPKRELLIAEVGNTPVGVLRLDHDDGVAMLSIYLDPGLVGLGAGLQVIRAAQRFSATRRPNLPLCAQVLPHNAASIRSFESAGFVRSHGCWRWEPGT